MRPLIWTNKADLVTCGALIGFLLSIELGTSRTATRAAADRRSEKIVDTSTSRLCDTASAIALAGGLLVSIGHPATAFTHQRAAFVAGSVVSGASGVLSKSARRHLGRFHRDALTIHEKHVLVESGPYRHVRHPLYTATIGAFAGIGLLFGNRLSVALAALPATALVWRITVEEAMLTEALGAAYTDYQKRTARLVPRLW